MPTLFENCNWLTYDKLIKFAQSNNGECHCAEYLNDSYNNKKYNYIENRQNIKSLYRKRICQTCYFLFNVDHYTNFLDFSGCFGADMYTVLNCLLGINCIKIIKVILLNFNNKLCSDSVIKYYLYSDIYRTLIGDEEYDTILELISSGLLDLSYNDPLRGFYCITIFDECILQCCEKVRYNNHMNDCYSNYYKKYKCMIFINELFENPKFLSNFKFTNIFKYIKNRVKYWSSLQHILYILLTNYKKISQKTINTNLSDIYATIKYFKDINFVDCYKKCINIIFDKDLIYRYKMYIKFLKNDKITNFSNNKSLTDTNQIRKYYEKNFYDKNVLSYTFIQDLCHNKFYDYIGTILSIFYYISKLYLPSEILYIIFNKLIEISIIDHT